MVEIFQTNIAHCDLLPGIQLAIGGRDARWGGAESEATTCACKSTGGEHLQDADADACQSTGDEHLQDAGDDN